MHDLSTADEGADDPTGAVRPFRASGPDPTVAPSTDAGSTAGLPGLRARRRRADDRLGSLMLAASVWLCVGMAVDAWAHKNVPSLETFFTPWHAVFYSGFGASVAVVLSGAWPGVRAAGWRGQARPWASPGLWWCALPEGYAECVAGIAVFMAGAVGDAIWHETLGVEKDLAALVSPTHLLLFAGVTLLVTAPLRAAWRQPTAPGAPPPTLAVLLPAILSVGLVITMFSFVTQNASPFVEPLAARSHADAVLAGASDAAAKAARALGMVGFVVQTVLLVGAMLLLARRWPLPVGSLTVLVGLNVTVQTALGELYLLIPLAVAAAFATDLLAVRLLRPTGAAGAAGATPWRLWLVAAALPALLWSAYLGGLALGIGGGLAWAPDLTLGAVVLASGTGALLGVVARPPALPPRDTAPDG